MVVDKKIVHVRQATIGGVIPVTLPGIADLSYPTSKTRRGRVIDDGQVSPTLTTENIPNVLEDWLWEIDGEWYCIRIRKLTPRECWRLMGFTDTDFEAAEAVNSNTQLYKQAGNSIVKQVLMVVFAELIYGDTIFAHEAIGEWRTDDGANQMQDCAEETHEADSDSGDPCDGCTWMDARIVKRDAAIGEWRTDET